MSRTEGISQEELDALMEPASDLSSSPLFSVREKAALAYGDAITASNSVDDSLFEAVRGQFSEEEIIELTATITWEICAAKFNRALELEWTCQLK